MRKKLSMQQCIEHFKAEFSDNIVHWKTIEEKKASMTAFPPEMDKQIIKSLEKRGISSLYTHQAEAFQLARQNRSFVAVTPTASGKTFCYNLPVLQSIIDDQNHRALYLFPTKALAQDQKSEINEFIADMDITIKSYTYDGDTSANIRQVIRQAGQVVITNPDMLHAAILPHHTKWVALFENLKYIVIDELHTYRGVFGSHVANVLRRLKRICAFYGSDPQFICTSATIANPKDLAQQLTGREMSLIDQNGAPSGRKHFVFYNPPVVNRALHIRRSATLETRSVASSLLKNKIQTIVFARSRVRVEIILNYLQQLVLAELGAKSIRGYRGGYLPSERREIEQGLRQGEIMGVVSTNALELGVDIGQLQACIMTGYPGSIASTWQQAGRAGRRQDESIVIMIASSTPMDQYIVQHPAYFLERNPETARIHPDNLIILVDHIKCAAYELPFKQGEEFGEVDMEEILTFLEEEKILYHQQDKWYWMNESFPAHNISLRSASQENVVIIDQTNQPQVKVIGEMDYFSAMTLLHEEAIYLHQGEQYQVEKLDYEEKKAFVRQVDTEYFTDANLAVQLKVLDVEKERESNRQLRFFYGEVTVNAMATIFKKIKFETHENIGSGPIHLPEHELHTSAAWLTLSDDWREQVSQHSLEHALLGMAHLLRHVAPLFVMCDPADIHVVPQIKSVHEEKATIFLYDRYPGGVGLSEQIYQQMEHILVELEQIIRSCSCRSGCPSCIGTMSADGVAIKEITLQILEWMMDRPGKPATVV